MASFEGFKGNYIGLDRTQVKQRLVEFGKNEIMPKKKKTLLQQIFGVVSEPMQLLLIITAAMYFVLNEIRDGLIMLVFVLFVAGIEIFQEWRTEKTLSALAELTDPKTKVIRNEEIIEIDSSLLVPGDLIVLEEGDKISADAKIIEMTDLGINESSLTGEAEIVWKTFSSTEERNFRLDYCYSGTCVIQGSAIAEVTGTGANSQYGSIGQDIASAQERPTPLQKQTGKLVKTCAIIAFAMFALVLTFTTIQHFSDGFLDAIKHGIMSGLTLAMGVIPEEFPVILAVFLAMGAWRLGRKKALIRHIPSVETLGAVSVLCVDKTGTLTVNRMTLQNAMPLFGVEEEELLNASVRACEYNPFDPMEQAILAYAQEKGIGDNISGELIFEYPFSSETKMMGHIFLENNKNMLYAKGAAELMIQMNECTDEQMEYFEDQIKEMSLQGLRVIAVAKAELKGKFPAELRQCNVKILGLIGLNDPPREEVLPAIKACHKAGVRVVMITGDNASTASSIAAKTGIDNPTQVIEGFELESMSDEKLYERLHYTNVFARVIPKHKLRIVEAFKAIGATVAMTGDGVNDAPALKASDIGIAMGERGTGVAKEAADMILLDDNFTTIVETIKDGRRIYANIRKAVGYVLAVHIPIALIALLTPLVNLPLLLLPIHVVLLELIIDPVCSIVFEKQPAEKDIMHRPPRSRDEKLLNSKIIIKSLLQGFFIFLVTFGAYVVLQKTNVDVARTVALAVLILSNLTLVYVNYSEKASAFIGFFKVSRTKGLGWLIPAIIIALGLLIYLPAMNTIAQTAPLNPMQLALTLGLSLVAGGVWEVVKLAKFLFKKKN